MFGGILRSNLSLCPAFGENDPKHPDVITECAKIALPMDPPMLEAKDSGNK
jgi:hypothetical protein